jgi:hypothetical protein
LLLLAERTWPEHPDDRVDPNDLSDESVAELPEAVPGNWDPLRIALFRVQKVDGDRVYQIKRCAEEQRRNYNPHVAQRLLATVQDLVVNRVERRDVDGLLLLFDVAHDYLVYLVAEEDK